VLRANDKLEKLYLNRSGVGDQTALAIASILTDNQYLHMLELKTNALTEKSLDTLLAVTKGNLRIVKLHIEENPIAEEKIKALEKVFIYGVQDEIILEIQ
jgi:hypothetical protein